MKLGTESHSTECLDNAYGIEGWFAQFKDTIETYSAIWTMGSETGQYTAITQLIEEYCGVKDWPVVVSVRESKGYVIPSEFSGSLSPMKKKGTQRLTRLDTPERFEQIQEYGLYQVPGRLCFSAEVDMRFERTGIESVWDVPNQMIASLNFVAQKALAYHPNLIENELPHSINTTPSDDNHREKLRKDVLRIGEESGLLIHVPVAHLNMEETMKNNRSLRFKS